MKEFYRLLEKDKLRRAAQQKPPPSHNDEEEDPEHRAQQDDRKRRRAYEQLDSGYSTRRVDEDATRRQGLDQALGSDNMGHQMLQRTGWREGGPSARAAPASRSRSTCGKLVVTRRRRAAGRSSSPGGRSGRRSTGRWGT